VRCGSLFHPGDPAFVNPDRSHQADDTSPASCVLIPFGLSQVRVHGRSACLGNVIHLIRHQGPRVLRPQRRHRLDAVFAVYGRPRPAPTIARRRHGDGARPHSPRLARHFRTRQSPMPSSCRRTATSARRRRARPHGGGVVAAGLAGGRMAVADCFSRWPCRRSRARRATARRRSTAAYRSRRGASGSRRAGPCERGGRRDEPRFVGRAAAA